MIWTRGDKFPIIGCFYHSFKRVSYRSFYLSDLQLKVKLKSYALEFEVNETSLVFLMCDMSCLHLISYVRKFMEKKHKNIIHIMDMTLPLITEFTLAVGYLSGSYSKAWPLYSPRSNDVSPLQVVRPKSLFGDGNKRSECDKEWISFTSSHTHEASMMLTWTSFPHNQYIKEEE